VLINMPGNLNVSTIFKIFFEKREKKFYLSNENKDNDSIIMFIKIKQKIVRNKFTYRNYLKDTLFHLEKYIFQLKLKKIMYLN